jgi:ADP-heptose:LPS heptosyltransferase
VVIHPGAASGSRRWPPERWAWLAARLVAAGDRVVISGGESERELCQHVVRQLPADGAVDRSLIQVEAGTKDLPELAELIARATLLICGDTGIAHLATAFGTPSVLLFGPTAPSWWGPRIDQQRHTVLWSAAPGYRGDPHADAVDPALLALSPEEVLDAADSMLDSLRRGARRAERTTPPSGQARQAS